MRPAPASGRTTLPGTDTEALMLSRWGELEVLASFYGPNSDDNGEAPRVLDPAVAKLIRAVNDEDDPAWMAKMLVQMIPVLLRNKGAYQAPESKEGV